MTGWLCGQRTATSHAHEQGDLLRASAETKWEAGLAQQGWQQRCGETKWCSLDINLGQAGKF